MWAEIHGHLAAFNRFLLKAERTVRQVGNAPLTARQLAAALNSPERTLNRRIRETSGEMPEQFIDRVRFETARTLLETTTDPVKELGRAPDTLINPASGGAFQRYSEMTPAAYRNWVKALRASA